VGEILSGYAGQSLNAPLDQLHKLEGFNGRITTMSGARLNNLQDMWNKERDRKDSNLFSRFDQIYTDFIVNVIAPSLNGGMIHPFVHLLIYSLTRSLIGRIVFQRAPSLRVQVPSEACLGSLHCDLDYHHQPSELNYWMILSDRSYDGASLHVEVLLLIHPQIHTLIQPKSYPNKGDFRPIEIKYGEFYRFYGNRCRHETVPNLTDTTRVSLDFRVVSDMTGGHDPTFHSGIRRGAKAKFQRKFDVNGFYHEINTPKIQINQR